MTVLHSRKAFFFTRGVVLLVILGWLWFPFSSLLSGSDIYLSKPVDDFYYYVRIAQHIVNNGMISFDGITLTNGFHPLWLAIITIVMFITGGAGPAFYIVIYLFCGVSAFITFELFLQAGKNLGMPYWLNLFLSIVLFPHTTGII